MTEISDVQLITRYLQESDEQSLEFLFGRYLNAVHYFVLRHAGGKAAAEDITQEIFVKVWKHLKKFDTNKSFKTWLFSIARNSCIDHLRKKRTLVFADFEDEEQGNTMAESLPDPEPLPQELLQNRESQMEFERALSGLPEASKTVILLHLEEQMTFKEIAEVLKQPLDTVKSRYRRGVLALRKSLQRQSVR